MGDLETIAEPELKIENCLIESLENHQDEIIKKLNNNENGISSDIEDYFISLEGLLLENCINFLKYREKGLTAPEQSSIKSCENLKTGTYYYEVLQPLEKIYLTFTKDEVIEIRKNNIYTISKIEWIEDCTYKLTQTNSNYDNIMLKNKPLTFRVIEDNPNYFIVQTQYHDNGGFNNVKIFKLPFLAVPEN